MICSASSWAARAAPGAVAGAAATYGADVVTYLLVIAALLWWKRPASPPDDLGEHFGGAMRAGLRYALASRQMHRILWRAGLFFAFGSAVWALLPLVARLQLGGGPGFYGVMLGSIGAGAIMGAIVMPRLRARLGQDGLVLAATITAGLAALVLALTRTETVALAATFVLGGAWIAVVVTLNAATQAILPNWVRGRGLAIYLTVFNGAMAAGALAWGLVAEAVEADRSATDVVVVWRTNIEQPASATRARMTSTVLIRMTPPLNAGESGRGNAGSVPTSDCRRTPPSARSRRCGLHP